ncbi:hypothetical protein [Periweissella cryptocerci]|nr:hypothetical protein [Periweissella cryptocerci]
MKYLVFVLVTLTIFTILSARDFAPTGTTAEHSANQVKANY